MYIDVMMRDEYMKMLFLFCSNRRRRMINSMFRVIIFFLLLLTISQAARVITVPLTHHHAFSSPTYNHSQSIIDRSHFDFHTSLRRASLVSPNNDDDDNDDDDDDDRYGSISLLIPQKLAGFLVHLQIGSQNLNQSVIMDTINSLFWINCQPCGIYVTPPAFDPASSSSYRTQDCRGDEEACSSDDVDLDCQQDNILGQKKGCSFRASYHVDQVYTSGELAIEDLKFGTELELKDVTFGCSHDANLYGANGIVGLGKSPLSIVRQQTFSTFSYCIGNISDPAYPHHRLILADTLNFKFGNETPISGESDNYYFINLEAIYIGNDVQLEFDPNIMRRNENDSSGGMVVDTCSTYTFLPEVIYKQLVGVVDFALILFTKNETFPYGGQARSCYNGVADRDLSAFPHVRLHFENEAIMELGYENLFHQVSEHSFCLGVLPIEMFYPRGTVSIMGILMQQNFYIAFDRDLDTFAFQRADCSLIHPSMIN